MTRHHLRNEMNSTSEKYCVDRADLGSAHGRKTDKHDAVSIGLAALEGADILQVACDDVTVSLRLLCDRREELTAQRTQAACRLHRLLAELTPGGTRPELTANKARALLARIARWMTSRRSACISPVTTSPTSAPLMRGSNTSAARSPVWSPRPAPR